MFLLEKHGFVTKKENDVLHLNKISFRNWTIDGNIMEGRPRMNIGKLSVGYFTSRKVGNSEDEESISCLLACLLNYFHGSYFSVNISMWVLQNEAEKIMKICFKTTNCFFSFYVNFFSCYQLKLKILSSMLCCRKDRKHVGKENEWFCRWR